MYPRVKVIGRIEWLLSVPEMGQPAGFKPSLFSARSAKGADATRFARVP